MRVILQVNFFFYLKGSVYIKSAFCAPGVAAYHRSFKVLQKVQTEESLHYYKLANDKYVALTQYPERLIRSLFEDCVADRFQTINDAADNIAEIYDINLKVLKKTLIQEWLPPIEQYQQDDLYIDNNFETNSTNRGGQNFK